MLARGDLDVRQPLAGLRYFLLVDVDAVHLVAEAPELVDVHAEAAADVEDLAVFEGDVLTDLIEPPVLAAAPDVARVPEPNRLDVCHCHHGSSGEPPTRLKRAPKHAQADRSSPGRCAWYQKHPGRARKYSAGRTDRGSRSGPAIPCPTDLFMGGSRAGRVREPGKSASRNLQVVEVRLGGCALVGEDADAHQRLSLGVGPVLDRTEYLTVRTRLDGRARAGELQPVPLGVTLDRRALLPADERDLDVGIPAHDRERARHRGDRQPVA